MSIDAFAPAPAADPTGATARMRRATTSSRVFVVLSVPLVAWLVLLTRGDRQTCQQACRAVRPVAGERMWNLLAGCSGLVSVGQQAFVGIGAYTLIVFGNGFDQDIYFSVLPAGVVAAVLAISIGLIAFRLRGAYFAVGTWVIAGRLIVTNNTGDVIKGGSGTSPEVPTSIYPVLHAARRLR